MHELLYENAAAKVDSGLSVVVRDDVLWHLKMIEDEVRLEARF